MSGAPPQHGQTTRLQVRHTEGAPTRSVAPRRSALPITTATCRATRRCGSRGVRSPVSHPQTSPSTSSRLSSSARPSAFETNPATSNASSTRTNRGVRSPQERTTSSASYATCPLSMRRRDTVASTSGEHSRITSACTRSTGANCSTVVLRTEALGGSDTVDTGSRGRRTDGARYSTTERVERSRPIRRRTQSGSYVALRLPSSATTTRVTRVVVPSAAWTRSQMNRARCSPVGTSAPSAKSGTSRLMLQ